MGGSFHTVCVLLPYHAACQNGLNGAPVEESWWQLEFPEPPQEVQPLLCLPDQLSDVVGQGEVLTDVDAKELEGVDPFHLSLTNV